jgi:hypothetical protein
VDNTVVSRLESPADTMDIYTQVTLINEGTPSIATGYHLYIDREDTPRPLQAILACTPISRQL